MRDVIEKIGVLHARKNIRTIGHGMNVGIDVVEFVGKIELPPARIYRAPAGREHGHILHVRVVFRIAVQTYVVDLVASNDRSVQEQ